jgi:hypothetical protein
MGKKADKSQTKLDLEEELSKIQKDNPENNERSD